MKKALSILPIIMLFVPFAARADIASKAYVDDRDKVIVYGTANPTQDQESDWEDWSGGDGVLGAMYAVNDELTRLDDNANSIMVNLIYGTDEPTGQQENDWDFFSNGDGVLGAIQSLDYALGDKMNVMDVDDEPTANSDNLVTSGGVAAALADKANVADLENAVGMKQSISGALLVTDGDGNVQVTNQGFIHNGLIRDDADIQLGKLGLPTPGQECETAGCMLIYYDGKYVWEVVTRDNNESISTTGYVDATADNNYDDPEDALGAHPTCQGNGMYWDYTTHSCEAIAI